ncbi:hypothetical protein ACN26Y_29925 [Micromonospora sp. WMMD558]|uniref:hypothetical protein n=1 Tax=Micromonospora sp. WMMD558 TaxID=3403462 RepID=UPI003BF525E9
MSATCDVCGTAPAGVYIEVTDPEGVRDEHRSRWSCANAEHRARAEATVGHGGRAFTVTDVDSGTGSGIQTEPVTLAEKFEAYDSDHPEVYATLRALAFEWKRRTGRHRLGIAALYERARWELSLQTGESPSLDHNFRAFYARKLMKAEPSLDGMFELRRSVADEWAAAA